MSDREVGGTLMAEMRGPIREGRRDRRGMGGRR